MLISPLSIADILLLEPQRFEDQRGRFTETYRRDLLADAGITVEFVQDNESLSIAAGTVRGLHYQAPPHAQAKLLRVVSGKIFDVVVDIRTGSPTFGQYATKTLSSDSGEQLFVPEGFAHGFCTLVDNTIVAYKVSAYYAHACEFGLMWNDPDLAIPWPVATPGATMSDRDRSHPQLKSMVSPFKYGSAENTGVER